MRSVWKFAAGVLAVSSLAACMGGGGGPANPFDGPGGDMHRPPGQESFSQVLAMRTEQGCPAALQPLRRFAGYGGGFEIAQFELGDCLVEEARKTNDKAARQSMAQEAEGMLLKAANSNEPNAQGLLAELYFRGDLLPKDNVKAGTWLLLYGRNNLRINLGARQLARGLESDMRQDLSDAEWATAKQAADAFDVTIQPALQPEQVGPEAPGSGRRFEAPDGDRRGQRQQRP